MGAAFLGPARSMKTSLIKTLHFCSGLGLKSLFFALKKRLFIDFVSFSYLKNSEFFKSAKNIFIGFFFFADAQSASRYTFSFFEKVLNALS